jgi:hypothetical protein
MRAQPVFKVWPVSTAESQNDLKSLHRAAKPFTDEITGRKHNLCRTMWLRRLHKAWSNRFVCCL